MKKRVILFSLLLVMGLGLAACGGKTSDTNKADANTTVEAEDTSREVAFNTDVDSSQKKTGDNVDIRFNFKIEDFTVDGMDIWTDDVVNRLMVKHDMVPTEVETDTLAENKRVEGGTLYSAWDEKKLSTMYTITTYDENGDALHAIWITTREDAIRFEDKSYENEAKLDAPNPALGKYMAPFYAGEDFASYYSLIAENEDLADLLAESMTRGENGLSFTSNLGDGVIYSAPQEWDEGDVYSFMINANSERVSVQFYVDPESNVVKEIHLVRLGNFRELIEKGLGDIEALKKELGSNTDNDTKTETELKLEITDPADGVILYFGADSFTLPVRVKELEEKGIEYKCNKDLFREDEAFSITAELMYKGSWWRDINMFLFNDISRSNNNLEESLLLTGFSVDLYTYLDRAFEKGMLDQLVAANFAINGLALGQELTNEDMEKLESFGFFIPEEQGWGRRIDMNGTTEYTWNKGAQQISIAIQNGMLVAFDCICW